MDKQVLRQRDSGKLNLKAIRLAQRKECIEKRHSWRKRVRLLYAKEGRRDTKLKMKIENENFEV